MRLKINGSYNLDMLNRSTKRFSLLVGSARSGKSFAVLQYILIYCFKNKDKVITIARKSFPSLRASAYREFIGMLKDYELYKEEHHNKTSNTYTLNGNLIQFISIDQSIKLRGLKHDLVFIDEVNELGKEEADQLFIRTTEKIIMAENPSDALHWSLTYQSNPDCDYIHSTYKQNPFLPQGVINQIESYKDTDIDMYNVYALGIPAKNNELVYSNIKPYSDSDLFIQDGDKTIPLYEDIIYGFDPGWNHPTALMKIYINHTMNKIWCEEIIHESFLTMDDVIQKMNQLGIDKDKMIFCDAAEPQRIETMKRAGYNAYSALKDVKPGIDLLKSMHFHLHTNSTRTWDETRKYKWRMKNEMKTDEPIKLFDDGLCAIRYAVYSYISKYQSSYDDIQIDIIDY